MKKITWIDLTDIVGWSGQHGGTQRVVYGIANQYYRQLSDKKNEAVGFFVYDSSSNGFYETDFGVIRDRVEASIHAVEGGDGQVSKKEKLKHYVIEYTPRFIRSNDKLRRGMFKAAKIGYIQMNNARKMLSRKQKSIKSYKGKKIDFTRNDTVLMLGKPWDEPKLTPLLADLKAKNKFKLCFVVYDLVIPLYPHLHSQSLFKNYTRYMFEAASAADLLLPISKSTEKDLLKFCEQLSIAKPNTQVIRLGDELDGATPIQPEGVSSQKPFLLCAGTIEVRKNHTLLYYVYKLAHERGIHLPQLIIMGRKGWLAEDIYNLLQKDKAVAQKVTILESVSDSGLAWLYENCLFTVYPSMYEGWGLPVAESSQYGKVTVASNASSIPEISGELLEYFSPYSVDACLHLLVKYLDADYRAGRAIKLKKSYKTTLWADTYAQVAKSLRSADM